MSTRATHAISLRHAWFVVLCVLVAVFPNVASLQSQQAARSQSPTTSASAVVIEGAPPPMWAKSFEITHNGAPLRVMPNGEASRRGALARGTRVAIKRRVLLHNGCAAGVWVETTAAMFVCETLGQYSPEPPAGEALPPAPEQGELLPKRYSFVSTDGAHAFSHPSDWLTDQYTSAFGRGFGVVERQRTVANGVEFVQEQGGLWLESISLRRARGSEFVGVVLPVSDGHDGSDSNADNALPALWALSSGVAVRAAPSLSSRIVQRLPRHAHRNVLEQRGGWFRVAEGWLNGHTVAVASQSSRPGNTGALSRWIDVNVDEQTLVAYEGDRPVYATLVSTGRDRPGFRTPEGSFPIWIKMAYSDMDDLERDDVNSNYALQDVPWVQYFKAGAGLHATFWHDDFGHRKSHGCVNLSPRDAQWLFHFTRPSLPPGWSAILPLPSEPVTVVRVR